MFGIGGFELVLILLFGFLIFGPDKLPAIAKTVGQAIGKFRRAQEEMSGTLKGQVFDKDADEPFKNPLDIIDEAADKAQKGAKEAKEAAGKAAQKAESFAERKARYDRERAARKAAEKKAALDNAAKVLRQKYLNNRIPWFFYAVFTEAFKPEAVFGGAFGTALIQGVKRGLMSNEAGQGTITMAAAASDAKHPCDQGFVQSIGVFLDTMVICTLTGFVVIMGRVWLTDGADAWFALDKLPMFTAAATELTPGTALNSAVSLLISVCFGLFAFSTLLGFVSFTEICSNRISESDRFINVIRILCLAVIAFGCMTSISGMDLSALWNLSDFANILIAYCNIPLLYIGFKYVLKATRHFEKNDGTGFGSDAVGIDIPLWDEKKSAKK